MSITSVCVRVCVCIYIHIYICIWRERDLCQFSQSLSSKQGDGFFFYLNNMESYPKFCFPWGKKICKASSKNVL